MYYINFIGRNRVGKSTFAANLATLLSNRNIRTVVFPFAESLRLEIMHLYGLPKKIVFTHEDKRKVMLNLSEYKLQPEVYKLWDEFVKQPITTPLSWRDLLIIHGTIIRRAQDPDYWVKAFTQFTSLLEVDVIITDDIRFQNEFDFIGGGPCDFWLNNDTVEPIDHIEGILLQWSKVAQSKMTNIDVDVPLIPRTTYEILESQVIPKVLNMLNIN